MLLVATVRPCHPAGQRSHAHRRGREKEEAPAVTSSPSGERYGSKKRRPPAVASYHLSLHPNVSRGKGQSLVRTAAYNGRTRLVDERTGEEWDYGHLGGVLFSGMYAPKDAPDWARDLGQLVNEVERFEKRSDSQLAMNLDIALPYEQTLEQNRRLLQDFVREQFVRQGYAAHVAIHEPDQNGDDRNIHAHVLVTLRKIGPNGFAPTKTEQQDRYRNRGEYTENLRDAWEKLANRHLERNGYDARIDRRSLQEQGIEREPQQHRGPTLTKMEREGRITDIGEKIRQRQQQHAELRDLKAEEKKIDAQIIDLAAERAKRDARAAAKERVEDGLPLPDFFHNNERQAGAYKPPLQATASEQFVEDFLHSNERQPGHYEPLHAAHQSTAREQFEGRYDALREAELPPDIVRVFAAGAARTSEPEAPTFDREAGESEWLDRVAEAGIAKGEPPRVIAAEPAIAADDFYPSADAGDAPHEAASTKGAERAGGALAGGAGEISGPPAAELESVDVAPTIERGMSSLFGGITKFAEMVISFFDWSGDAKLTKQQRHEKAQARGNEETLQAEAYAEVTQAIDAEHEDRAELQKKDEQERNAEIYRRFGHILIRDPDQPKEIELDGGREREREP
jgi:hypothetical protein